MKGAVALAMNTVFAMMEGSHEHLDLFCNPSMVRCNSTMQRGDLMPAPTTMRIDRKDSQGAICVGKSIIDAMQPEPVYITTQFQLPLNTDQQSNKGAWVCPFFQLRDAPKNKPNMILKAFLQNVGGMQIRVPVLVNAKPLTKDDELTWEKATAKAFLGMRTYVDETDWGKGAKRRKTH